MKSNHRAFTLIEVLVTLAISSMILLIGTVSMKFMVTSLAKNSSTIPSSALAYTQIRSTVAATFPYVIYVKKPFDSTKNDYHFFYEGNSDSIRFISEAPLRSRVLSVVELSLSNHQLTYKESPLYALDSNYLSPSLSSNPYTLTLLDKIDNGQWQYETNSSVSTRMSGDIPKRLKLSFEDKGKKYVYIFEINTDYIYNINNVRRQIEPN